MLLGCRTQSGGREALVNVKDIGGALFQIVFLYPAVGNVVRIFAMQDIGEGEVVNKSVFYDIDIGLLDAACSSFYHVANELQVIERYRPVREINIPIRDNVFVFFHNYSS